jgi:hypothetical protein
MKWEYMPIALKTKGFLGEKVDPDELTARLDEAGESGYELVSVFATSQSEGATREVLAVFKRER